MPFVKLDCGILNSTIWIDRDARELFVTALLMAEPREVREPMDGIEVDSLSPSGFTVPVGWYGFVPAAGSGIIRMAGIEQKDGIEALRRLASPESESRTPDHEGRRMVRVDGGYIILNFDKYRQKDHTAAERSRRYRDRKLTSRVANVTSRVTSRSVTQAEAEAEADQKQEVHTPEPPAKKPRKGSGRPTIEELTEFCTSIGLPDSDGEATFWKWEGNGYVNGKTPIKNWQATIRNWKLQGFMPSQQLNGAKPSAPRQSLNMPDGDFFTK